MIKPRWLARVIAWLTNERWLMCPICKKFCADSEQARGVVNSHVYLPIPVSRYYHFHCCQDPLCITKAQAANVPMSKEEFDQIMLTGGSHCL